MGIGTSLGAYFETSLDHHAGNEYLDNPSSTPDNNELSTNEVMPQAPEPVNPAEYETHLTPDQEIKFQDWKSKMAPKDSGHDYDLRGAFLNNVSPDKESGHWPDTFKKPNHPTFSDQSMYAGERPDLAGKWAGDKYLPPGKIIPISDIKTASPLVTITDEDIDKAMGLGMSFSGGGLSTTIQGSKGVRILNKGEVPSSPLRPDNRNRVITQEDKDFLTKAGRGPNVGEGKEAREIEYFRSTNMEASRRDLSDTIYKPFLEKEKSTSDAIVKQMNKMSTSGAWGNPLENKRLDKLLQDRKLNTKEAKEVERKALKEHDLYYKNLYNE